MRNSRLTVKLFTAVCVFFVFSGNFSVFSQDALYKGEKYSFDVFYDKKTNPGDALFISMIFHFNDASGQPAQTAKAADAPNEAPAAQSAAQSTVSAAQNTSENQPAVTASCTLTKKGSDKKITSADFYTLSHVLMTGFPIPINTEPGEYTLEVIYTAAKLHKMMFTLPVTVKSKEFICEDVKLDGTATAIKKDTSPERAQQIQQIQNIFSTVDTFAFYHQGPFIEPLPAGTVRSSGFGDKRTYLYSDGTSEKAVHYGIDYDVPIGTSVKACAGGKVIMAENRISTGWTIGIEHLPGLYSFYYHLDSIAAVKGDIIKQGTEIGKSGSTGMATGPHLHWEVRFNKEPVNPDYFTNKYARFWK